MEFLIGAVKEFDCPFCSNIVCSEVAVLKYSSIAFCSNPPSWLLCAGGTFLLLKSLLTCSLGDTLKDVAVDVVVVSPVKLLPLFIMEALGISSTSWEASSSGTSQPCSA